MVRKILKRLFGKKRRKAQIKSVDLAKLSEQTAKTEEYSRKVVHANNENLEQRVRIYKNKKGPLDAQIRILNEGKETLAVLHFGFHGSFMKKYGLEKGQPLVYGTEVTAERMREGLFKQMLSEAENIAKNKMGANKIFLSAIDRKAEKIYKRLGFRNVMRRGKKVTHDRAFPIMEKSI